MENTRNIKGQFLKGIRQTKHKAVLGIKYDKYEVISDELFFREKDTHPHFKVKCQCGTICKVRADWLVSGKRKQCKICSSKATYKKALKTGKKVGFITHHAGIGNLTKTAYGHFKRNAKKEKRNLVWELNIDYLWELFLKQDKKCALTGLDIHLTEKRKKSNIDWDLMTASLDRIDSSRGYTKDNVQWLHKDINRLKNNYSQDKFIEMCRLVTKNSEK